MSAVGADGVGVPVGGDRGKQDMGNVGTGGWLGEEDHTAEVVGCVQCWQHDGED